MILTFEKILKIHKLIIRNFDGIDGLYCQSTIDYPVDQFNVLPDLLSKAALVLIS